MIRYEHLNTQAQFERVAALEELIWRTSPRETISTHMQRVVIHTGGCIIGAYDQDQLVGFTLGVPTQATGQLWSHIAGVHPDYQSRGIGYSLKQEQRTWAMSKGYTRIHWTFDPLLRPNAHFNFRLLRVKSKRYHENFYGEMSDGINAGLPTDRLEVAWSLEEHGAAIEAPSEAHFLLHQNERGYPESQLYFGDEWFFAEIPYHFAQIKAQNKDLALQWRMALRETMDQALRDYSIVDFVREDGRAWYVLRRELL